MNKKLSKEQYLEILRNKRKEGTDDFADRVFYNGKVARRCPPGTGRMGNTCIPGLENQQKEGGSKNKFKKDLGGIDPEQIKKLNKAKNTKDVQNARKSNG